MVLDTDLAQLLQVCALAETTCEDLREATSCSPDLQRVGSFNDQFFRPYNELSDARELDAAHRGSRRTPELGSWLSPIFS